MTGIAYIPMLLLLIFVIALPVLIGVYVYKDASGRGMNAALWTLLAILAPGFVGLIIYLIVRSNYTDACCHKCGKPVRESFVVCPHCGASLKEHCYNCNGTLESGWANCPHCGTPIPEEQKAKMTATVRKDKGIGMLLLVLLVVPIVLCIVLVIAFGLLKTTTRVESSGYSYSHSMEPNLGKLTDEYPFLKDWIASCDAQGNGTYVLKDTKGLYPSAFDTDASDSSGIHSLENTYRFFVYRNDGSYSFEIDIVETGAFASKREAHLTYLSPYKYSSQDLLELELKEAPTHTFTVFEFVGDDLEELRVFDTNGKEIDYK